MTTFNRVLAELDHGTAGLTFLGSGFVSYAALGALIRGNAEHFAARGLRRGDRVAMIVETDLEHVVALLAVMAIGAVPLSLKPRRGSADDHASYVERALACHRVRHVYRTVPAVAGAEVLAWDAAARSDAPSVFADVEPDDVCFVQFSSGAMGDPKPIPISHRNLLANLGAILEIDGRSQSSIGYNFLPLSHDMGLIGGLLSNLVRQNPLYLSTPRRYLSKPLGFLSSPEARDIVVAMPDFALRYLVRHLGARDAKQAPRLLHGLRHVYCGAEPIRYETIRSVVEIATRWGFDPSALIFSYGMAEATLLVTSHRFRSLADGFVEIGGRMIASVGTAAPETTVCVGTRDADGRISHAAPGSEAALFVRGPSVFRGYLGGDPLADGWHDTGDLGFERDGELYVSGRGKDLIIINGENVFPADIEDYVSALGGIRECVVLADGDRFYTFVVTAPSARFSPDAIAEQIGVRFGAVPAAIIFGTSSGILRTGSGKPMRQAMLAQLRAQDAVS